MEEYLIIGITAVLVIGTLIGLYLYMNKDTCKKCNARGGMCKHVVDGSTSKYTGCVKPTNCKECAALGGICKYHVDGAGSKYVGCRK